MGLRDRRQIREPLITPEPSLPHYIIYGISFGLVDKAPYPNARGLMTNLTGYVIAVGLGLNYDS